MTANEDTTVGDLGLSDEDENDVVAFLQTLTDGYTTSNPDVTAKIERNLKEMRKNLQQQEARNSGGNHPHGAAN